MIENFNKIITNKSYETAGSLLSQLELEHLNATDGNFLTEKMINEQKALNTNIQDLKNTNNDL